MGSAKKITKAKKEVVVRPVVNALPKTLWAETRTWLMSLFSPMPRRSALPDVESPEPYALYLSRRFPPREASLVLISSSVASSGKSDRPLRRIEVPELLVGVGEPLTSGVVAAARAKSIEGSIRPWAGCKRS